MHAIIFRELKNYVDTRLGSEAWHQLLANCGMEGNDYTAIRAYPDRDAFMLVESASKITGMTTNDILGDFGQFIGENLVGMYWYLINPEWKTLDVIANTEASIHTVIRSSTTGAEPPHLKCIRLSETEVLVMYSSHRKMCNVAKGIIQGIARHYQETVELKETKCMHDGFPWCEISVLLTNAPHSQTVISNSELPKDTSGPIAPPIPDNETHVPQETVVPGYELLEKIGQGGMGIVYKALQHSLDRQVAIKIISPQFQTEDHYYKRLQREAKAMGKIFHPHIVSAIDFGVHNDLYYIVMEYIPGGKTMQDVIRDEGKIPEQKVLRIALAMAYALQCLERHKIVHRDIKPSNILINPQGVPKLTDLGIIKKFGNKEHLTVSGARLGTFSYMSMEQVEARKDIDIRADIYSLGATSLHALLGDKSFKKLGMVFSHTQSGSNFSVNEVGGEVSAKVNRLICKMLRAEREERQRNADELIAEIQQTLEN